MTEQNFDFNARYLTVHPLRCQEDALPAQDSETEVTDGWFILPESDDKVLLHGAHDLADYFQRSMGVRVCSLPYGSVVDRCCRCISIGVAGEKSSLTCRLNVLQDSIRITGATPREAAQGCYRLEDEMNFRGIPAVARGERTFTRMFSPRMTHSGFGMDNYPDEYLAQIAHAGMDAIILFIEKAPDVTGQGRTDINAIVERASEFGLDVYLYPRTHRDCLKNPADSDALEFYDGLYGSMIKNAPGVKGIIFVGESVAYPTADPHTSGYWWDRRECKPGLPPNGFWPSTDFSEWLHIVRDATRKYNPKLDILFWSYNWFWAPEENRLALIQNLPRNVTLHVTFEMSTESRDYNGISMHVDDYSITSPGPGHTFVSEAVAAKERGLKLSTMSNTAGMTWDFGTVPYQPAPYRWLDRFVALRKAKADWNLSGLMDSHHYGFSPNFIADFAKICFTEEFGMASAEHFLLQLAARDFGRRNAGAVVSAWRDWSDAYTCHSARSYDQYGALRVGPDYPFLLPGEQIPSPLHSPREQNADDLCHNGWHITNPDFGMPVEDIPVHLNLAEREMKFLTSGNDKLKRILPLVPTAQRPAAERMVALGQYLYHTVRTMRNVKQFFACKLQMQEPGAKQRDVLALMRKILLDERENVTEAIPVVETDSRLGWEPSIGYIADRANLEWKLDLLARLLQKIDENIAKS